MFACSVDYDIPVRNLDPYAYYVTNIKPILEKECEKRFEEKSPENFYTNSSLYS